MSATRIPEATLTFESGGHDVTEFRAAVDSALGARGEAMNTEYPITIQRDEGRVTISGPRLGVLDFRDRLAETARGEGLKRLRVDGLLLFPHEAEAV